MSIWDSVSTTYVEAASTALPLHRAMVFLAGFFGSIAVANQTHKSIFETVARLPLSDLSSFATGPLKDATFADVFLGIFITICGWIFSRLVLRAVFSIAARATDLWNRANSRSVLTPVDQQQSLNDRQIALDLIDASLSEPKARLRSLSAIAELFGGIGCGCLLAAFWGNYLDGLVGIALMCGSAAIQVFSVRIFLADYFGPALLKAKLQGKSTPSLP